MLEEGSKFSGIRAYIKVVKALIELRAVRTSYRR
jgi:hypothetical protein